MSHTVIGDHIMAITSGVFYTTLGMGPGPLGLGVLAAFSQIGNFKNSLFCNIHVFTVFLEMCFISIRI
jgi:hypothetical protein